jgi:hypothetical protein
VIETKTELEERQSQDLPKPMPKTDFAKKLLCQKKRTCPKSPKQTCRNFF